MGIGRRVAANEKEYELDVNLIFLWAQSKDSLACK